MTSKQQVDYNQPATGTGAAGSPRVYDLIGVGYGPANLALSIALREEAEKQQQPLQDMVWLEKSEEFAW